LAPRSGSPKCLRFGLWLTLCTLNIDLLTYLLIYQPAYVSVDGGHSEHIMVVALNMA